MSTPAPKSSITSANLKQLQALADHKQSQLIKKYPVFSQLFSDSDQTSAESKRSDPSELNQSNHHSTSDLVPSPPLLAPVSNEEVNELFVKLKSAISTHELWQTESMRLYLEQQITDLLGFSVTSVINQEILPVWHGRVKALKHQKRYVEDTLTQHRSYLEAGLSRYRTSLQLTTHPEELISIEQYGVCYPVWLLKNYQDNQNQAFSHFKHFKWLLINPFAEKLVVGETAGVFAPSHRYSLGLSPELVRLGRFWWPGMTGEALCLLIDQNCPSGLIYG